MNKNRKLSVLVILLGLIVVVLNFNLIFLISEKQNNNSDLKESSFLKEKEIIYKNHILDSESKLSNNYEDNKGHSDENSYTSSSSSNDCDNGADNEDDNENRVNEQDKQTNTIKSSNIPEFPNLKTSKIKNLSVNISSNQDNNQISWLISQQNTITGLVDSYQGDGQNYAYTYDQALAIIAFTIANKTEEAELVLDKMQQLQLANGAWYQCYDFQTGNLGHYGCNFYPTGDISWMVMAINFYEKQTSNKEYSNMANKALVYLENVRNTNPLEEKYGSLDLCSGTECQYPDAISSENNYDAYSAYFYRGILENNHSFIKKANLIKEYIITEMWAPSPESNGPYHNVGVFWVGYNDFGWYTDPQSWGVLALGENYSLALEWLYSYGYGYGSTRHTQTYNVNNQLYDGFDFWTKPDKNSIWIEGTEGVAAAYYFIGDNEKGNYFHNQTKQLISSNGGIIYSFSQINPSSIRYPDNFRYNSVASTSWYYFNEKKINPFKLPILVKFRTSNTSYSANTKISINENCDGDLLSIHSSDLFIVSHKSCGDLYGFNNTEKIIENIPYTGGMFGGLWECSSPIDLYKYSEGYYVCCSGINAGSLARPYKTITNETETSETIEQEKEYFC